MKLPKLLYRLWNLQSANTKTLKSYLSRDVRWSKKFKIPMERSELTEMASRALRNRIYEEIGTTLTTILPYLVTIVAIVLSWVYCRRKHLNPKWVLKEAVLNVLSVFQFCMFLGAVLSWCQHPYSFPRIAVEMVTRPVYRFLLDLIPFDSDIIRPFLPLVCGYLIRRLREKILFSTLDIQRGDERIIIAEEEEEEEKEEELPNFTFSASTSTKTSTILTSSDPILAQAGREQIFEDALADMSSYVCKKCGGIVACRRREAHEKYWCEATE